MPKPNIIIATSPQLLVGMTGWFLNFVRGIPFILEVRDLWPDSITASGVGNQTSTLARSLSALSGFLYRNCNHLVVVTPAFKKEIVDKYGIHSEKISVVENGVEIDLFKPGAKGVDAKKVFDLEDKFLVSIIGTFGLAHGLSSVLQVAERVQNEYPDIVFIFVGEGADKGRLMDMAQSMGLENVLFKPQQPREKIPSCISASDVCLVLLKKAPVFKTVIPTKMLEFMACGRPVILGVDGQARQVIEESKGGIFVEPENSEELKSAVIKLYKDVKLRNELGNNGRQYIVNNLSREKTAKDYIKVLTKIVST